MNKKLLVFLIILWEMNVPVFSQNLYYTKEGRISLYSHMPTEDIRSVNKAAVSILNIQNGEVSSKVSIRDFKFDNSLMEEHFNENYMESSKYPSATLQGKLLDIDKNNLSQKGKYEMIFEGELTIHGVKKTRKIPCTIVNDGSKINVTAKFDIPLEDHKIERPQLLWQKLADKIETTINFTYDVYKK